MRGLVRGFALLLAGTAVGAICAPFVEPGIQSYLQEQGYYDDTPAWWLRQMNWVFAISSHAWFPWSAGAALGFAAGVWIDWALRLRERRSSIDHYRLARRADYLSDRIKDITGNLLLYSDQIDSVTSETYALLINLHKAGYATLDFDENLNGVENLKRIAVFFARLAPLIASGHIDEAKHASRVMRSAFENQAPQGTATGRRL